MYQIPSNIQQSINKTRQTNQAIDETLWASIYSMDLLSKPYNTTIETKQIKSKIDIIFEKHKPYALIWLWEVDHEVFQNYIDSLNKENLSNETKKEMYMFFWRIYDSIMKGI